MLEELRSHPALVECKTDPSQLRNYKQHVNEIVTHLENHDQELAVVEPLAVTRVLREVIANLDDAWEINTNDNHDGNTKRLGGPRIDGIQHGTDHVRHLLESEQKTLQLLGGGAMTRREEKEARRRASRVLAAVRTEAAQNKETDRLHRQVESMLV